jgi:hypothetical protein
VTDKIRSGRGPLIIGRRESADFGSIDRRLERFVVWNFGRWVQRRGARVNTLEIGSRVGVFCSGGILGFYADLRRKYNWGNLFLVVFGILGGGPRSSVRRGDHLACILCVWRNLSVELGAALCEVT